ncbi:uncharacterized protein SCHCODRAFT_02734338 [Schizophyllum commune H4-8]|uniref:Uncharacterized protein n=1 Tax=Schizophyllum commune (strain H4-8 / FGSC 9210) TaxID=578458 RepID=D8Q6M3_SCHCM|nr:uncharacterized protein SCHCODRAFT_02734338 [Schizophyllum commune H4-8]KAI5890880.1 hypothetical protein SCHCODRAFT_02734338 [Schizophyllum commune H4-8]
MASRYRCLAPLHISSSPGARATLEVYILYDGPKAGIYTDSGRAPKYAYTCSTIAHGFYMWEINCENNHQHLSPPLPNAIDGTIHGWCTWRILVNKAGDCGFVHVDEQALERILERLRNGLEKISEALMREQAAQPRPPQLAQSARATPAALGGAYRVATRGSSPDIWQDVPLAPPPPPPSSNRPTRAHHAAPPSPVKSTRTSRSPVKRSEPVASSPLPSIDISSDEDEALYVSARASATPARRPSPSKPSTASKAPTPKSIEAIFSAKAKGVAFSTTASATVGAPRARSSSPRKKRASPSSIVAPPSMPSTPSSIAPSPSVASLTDALSRHGLSVAASPPRMPARWWVVCQGNGMKRTTASLAVAQTWLAEAESQGLEAELKVAEDEDELAALLLVGRANLELDAYCHTCDRRVAFLLFEFNLRPALFTEYWLTRFFFRISPLIIFSPMGRLRKEPTARKQTTRGNPGIWFDRRKDILVSHKDKYVKAPRKEKKIVVEETVDAYLDEYPYHFNDPPIIPEGASEEECARIMNAAKDDARAEAGPQINSWLKNQVTKANAVTKNPFRTFLAQSLKNLAATKPAHVPEHKMWMKQPEYRDVFLPIFEERWAKADLSSEQELTQRVQIAQEIYEEQDEEVKKHVRSLVKEDYERRLALRNSVWDEDEITEESAELCRENISKLIEPLLEELCRLCKLNVGTIMLARPPQDEFDKFECISVDVGRTIASEGSLKLPDFEPDKYSDLYLRWFLRFVVHTTERSAALQREQEERERQAAGSHSQQKEPRAEDEARRRLVQVAGVPAAAEDDASGAKRRPRQGRRRRHRRGGIDAHELSGDETAESSMDENLDDGEGSGPEEDGRGEALAARAFEGARQSRARAHREKEHIPVDEYGVPLRDVKGREFSAYLRERLSRMAPGRRTSLLNEMDRMSDYELNRQDTISRNECTIRASLLKEGLLTEADPLWGDVVPQKIVASQVHEGGGDTGHARSASPAGAERGAVGADEPLSRPFAQPPVPSEADVDTPSQRAVDRDTPADNGEEQGSAGDLQSVDGCGDLAPIEQGASRDHRLSASNNNEADNLRESVNLTPTNGGAEDNNLVGNSVTLQGEEDSPGAQQGLKDSALTPADARLDEQPGIDNPRRAKASKGRGAVRARGRKVPTPLAQDKEGGGAGNIVQGAAVANATPGTTREGGGKHRRGLDDERPGNIFSVSRAGWLDWVSLGVDNLALDDVATNSEADKAWRTVVATWWVLEKHDEFKKDKRVPANGCRPKEIGEWIKRARMTTFAPQVPANTPPEDFLDDWKASIWRWWSSLNPQWRQRNTDGKVGKGRGTAGDWLCLHYPGLNGHLSVLKGVKWWFDLEGNPGGSRSWLELVEDIQWALDGVLKQLRTHVHNGTKARAPEMAAKWNFPSRIASTAIRDCNQRYVNCRLVLNPGYSISWKEEQRRLVDEDWDVITALRYWSAEAPDRALYESMSATIESTWFSSFQDRRRDSSGDPTNCSGSMEQDTSAVVKSMSDVADRLEQLNRYLDIAPQFIEAANELIDALDAAEAADIVSRSPGALLPHLNPSSPPGPPYGDRLHIPASRTPAPWSSSASSLSDSPIRTTSLPSTRPGSARYPSTSPSPAPSSTAEGTAPSLGSASDGA